MERVQLIPYEIRASKLHQYETKDSKHNSFTKTSGEDVNQRKFYRCFAVCTLCMLFLFIAYVPVTYHQARAVPSSLRPATIVGWSQNTNRDLIQYVLPNNLTSLIPGADICPSPLYLLVVVCSSVANFEARLAIRETWASIPFTRNNSSIIRLAFLLGDPDNATMQELVSEESGQYEDVIQEGFLDTYNNLTLKSVMLLKWVTTRCQGARFIMKTDDDMFVNLVSLVKLLRGKPGQGLLLGTLICGAKPISDPSSKWFAPQYMFSSRVYPNYLSGTGYVMSFDVAKRLYREALNTPLFHLEDVYVTGICSKSAGIRPRDNGAFTFNHRKIDPCLYRAPTIVTSHRLSPQELRKVWAQMNSPFLDCSKSITTTIASNAKQDHKKKKQTTFQVLETLENKIQKIENFRRDTEQRQKTVVGHLIIYSVGLYVLAAIFFYFYYFPADLKGKVLCITPLLVFPIIVILIKRLVTWYFHRKILRNQELISEMKDEKRQLLENVKDKETYKVAKEILEKFAPEQLRKPMPLVSPSSSKELILSGRPSGSSPAQSLNTSGGEVRKRLMGPQMNAQRTGPVVQQSPGPVASPTNNGQFPIQRGLPMPRPVFPRDRGNLDKLVEYLVGDGPSNRYALICRQCKSHNGMALKEEFDYLAFRCCYCYGWNPARKQRPQAPQLQISNSEPEPPPTSGSELESGTDTTDDDSDEKELSKKESPLLEGNILENYPEKTSSTNSMSNVETGKPDVSTPKDGVLLEKEPETNKADVTTSESDSSLLPPASRSSDFYLSDL